MYYTNILLIYIHNTYMKLRNAHMVDETVLCKGNVQNDYFITKKSLVNANDLLDAFNPDQLALYYFILFHY